MPLDRPAAVEMLFEGNRRIIGLKPTDPQDGQCLCRETANQGELQAYLGGGILPAYST